MERFQNPASLSCRLRRIRANVRRYGLRDSFFAGKPLWCSPQTDGMLVRMAGEKIFPKATAFSAYCRGLPPFPDFQVLGKQENVRYWLTGTWLKTEGMIQVFIALHDIRGSVRDITLPLSPADGMVAFRRQFHEWLAGVDLSFPSTDSVFGPNGSHQRVWTVWGGHWKLCI